MDKVIIRGKIPSKSNCYHIVTMCGHGTLAKTKVVKEYELNFFKQCQYRGLNIDRPFKLNVDVYYINNQPDLDNCLKVLLDCMQQCKMIKNDRDCFEINARKLIDKVDPRVEFTIEELI